MKGVGLWIIGGVVIALIVSGAVLLYGDEIERQVGSPERNEPAPDLTEQVGTLAVPDETVSEVVVSVDGVGFSPSVVTIPVGTTVKFVNNGQGAHWPASDVHPTHEILPEFDSKRGLATGESFSYTFTQPGTWPFHDHLNPEAKGTVVVQ